MIGIYMYENKLNHKKYIGQSVNIERRKKEHLNYPSPHSKFDNHLSKLGEDNFIFSILEECKIEELDEKEKYWIEYYNSIEEGYNLIIGGQSYQGESNPYSKLTENEVKKIINLLELNQLNNEEIANIFSVHRNTIDNINRCQTWKYLHSYEKNIRQENLNKRLYPHSTLAGESSKNNKISEQQALQIIQLLISDERSMAQLSRDLNISIYIIQDINSCRTWKHLHNYTKNIRKNI